MVVFQAGSFAFCNESDFRAFLVTQKVEGHTAQNLLLHGSTGSPEQSVPSV